MIKVSIAELLARKPLNLHLGCGTRHIPGFVHIDLNPSTNVDYQRDVRDLSCIPSESVDLVYASHVLEHFGRYEYRDVLTEWRRVLKPSGILRLSVPDFAACAALYYEQGLADGLSGLIGLVSGGQRDAMDYHRMIFDEALLAEAMISIGFENVRRWNWRETEHASVDDYSQAYIPHMDKEGGRLMSLNLQGTRSS